MKSPLRLCGLALLGTLPATAAVVYVDISAVSIPNTIEGVYLNILTGTTSTDLDQATFNSGPWINLFLGGTGISSSELLRPWASTGSYDANSDYFVNLAPGTTVDAAGLFVTGESVSVGHVGGAGNQFQSGVTGFLAFAYQASVGAGTSYGWLSFAPNASGPGSSTGLAYSDTPGESLVINAIPEPASFAVLAGLVGLAAVLGRRSGHRVRVWPST
jgi:hypothetical protein